MKALVYKQAVTYHDKCLPFNVPLPVNITGRDLLYGFVQVLCRECGGTGDFDIHGELQPCVACKSSGKEWVTL